MTNPDGGVFGDDEIREDDTWEDAARVASARDSEANEADLIEQAIAVPDDDAEFDR